MNNLATMLATLTQGDVEFVLVGGYAAVTHGVSLVTQDVDICCRFSKENLLRLQTTPGRLAKSNEGTEGMGSGWSERGFRASRQVRSPREGLGSSSRWFPRPGLIKAGP